MVYTSTRNSGVKVPASQAISEGISSEGGLFLPVSIPQLSVEDLKSFVKKNYVQRAEAVLSMYLTDFSAEEISRCVSGAYASGKFSDPEVAPLKKLYDNVHVLELWKGPTCAFKDMALQLLPYLLNVSAEKAVPGKEIVILVATSGDTGKAALEGFKDVAGTKIMVFYPDRGVSPMQKLQMTTQEGANVAVCAIEGNFDDAQNGVKAIFTDKALGERLKEKNAMFSSANSINWGRLVPQIVYYISAYCDLVAKKNINLGDKINIVVPTGNFGNILAAYYAKKMGVPVNKLICASNSNNVLTEFIKTGTYDSRRRFYTTISPSMDILVSSNLERLLYLLADMDDAYIKSLMNELVTKGSYNVTQGVEEKIKDSFAAGYCDDGQTKETIARTFKNRGYLCDTHTAVAVKVYEDYRHETGDGTPAVIASTASPFKFSASVLEALNPSAVGEDEFEMLKTLEELTGVNCPHQLKGLEEKKIRFDNCCATGDMKNAVLEMLGI